MTSLTFSFPEFAKPFSTYPSAFKLPKCCRFCLFFCSPHPFWLVSLKNIYIYKYILYCSLTKVLKGSELDVCSIHQHGPDNPYYTSTCFDVVSASIAPLNYLIWVTSGFHVV